MEQLILDVTTIITFISDTCNDPNIYNRYEEKWKKKNKLIYQQIKNEQSDPIKIKLDDLFNDRILLTTNNALEKSKLLIENYGSDLENKNLKLFINRLEIIKDDPSIRISEINIKYITDLNKSVFGTADKLNMTLVTGNINSINILMNDDKFHDFKYIAHRSRCFVGKKNV
jgi:hypothetical protein